VNNAGDQIRTMPIEEMDEELWDLVLAVNLKGAFLCARACIPGMKAARWGRIVNMSSVSARSGGGPGAAHYAASKAGLESLTRSLARELGPFGITANAVAPGVVLTPIHERHNTPENLEKLRQTVPVLRLGMPTRWQVQWPSSPPRTPPTSAARCFRSTVGCGSTSGWRHALAGER